MVTLTLTVTDNDGVTASDDVMITVPGTDPTVSIETEDQDRSWRHGSPAPRHVI